MFVKATVPPVDEMGTDAAGAAPGAPLTVVVTRVAPSLSVSVTRQVAPIGTPLIVRLAPPASVNDASAAPRVTGVPSAVVQATVNENGPNAPTVAGVETVLLTTRFVTP